MSKSEMIKGLQSLKKRIYLHYQDLWQYEEMLDEAIAAIEVSEDCISREYLLSKVYDMDNDNLVVDLKDIENAPSVVPSRAEGEWVESEIPNELYVCSECGGACWSYDCERNIVKSNYCPNCGAKMKGADND